MEIPYSLEDLKQLDLELTKNPFDMDLMNKLAISCMYWEHLDEYVDRADELLEKAFDLAPSIKSANNYAYQIIMDRNDFEKGIEILQPYINKGPNSFMPYVLIGYAYLMIENYKFAETYFEKAINLEPTELFPIYHNLGVCKCHLNQLETALELFEKSILIEDNGNESKYNKAICQVELGDFSEIDSIIDEIRNSDVYQEPFVNVCNIDLSLLCYLMNDFKKAYDLLMESPNFDLFSHPELCFLLQQYNASKYDELVEELIERTNSWIAKLNNPEYEFYDRYTEEERLAEIQEENVELEEIMSLKERLVEPPKIKSLELYKTLYCGCLLYDCKVHNTAFKDE